MRNETPGSTSRRTFVKYGLLSTGALVGPSSAGAAAESTADSTEATDGTIEQGVMRSYQYAPNSRVTVRDAVDWRPQGLTEATGSYVVAYDSARSYRALLFTTAEDAAGGATDLESGDTLTLGSVRGSPSDTSRRYVTVGLEADE